MQTTQPDNILYQFYDGDHPYNGKFPYMIDNCVLLNDEA